MNSPNHCRCLFPGCHVFKSEAYRDLHWKHYQVHKQFHKELLACQAAAAHEAAAQQAAAQQSIAQEEPAGGIAAGSGSDSSSDEEPAHHPNILPEPNSELMAAFWASVLADGCASTG